MMGLFDANGGRFKSKKMLKEYCAANGVVQFEETSYFGAEFKGAGTYCVVLPTPQLRKSFANVTVTSGGRLIKVA